jgi:hypothetical protein
VKILDRLPINDQPALLFWGPEPITIKRYQIAVWVSFNHSPRPFPALVDTGHSHNFSITESQLRKFAQLTPDGLKFIGTTSLKGERLKQFRVDIQIHRNRPGTMELGEGAHSLQLDEGVSLAPEGSARLPLLGLRALVRSGLKLTIDGRRRTVHLRTAGWF